MQDRKKRPQLDNTPHDLANRKHKEPNKLHRKVKDRKGKIFVGQECTYLIET